METRLKEKTPACLWMQAGVVKKKICIKDFLCTTCRFERALRKTCHENEDLQKPIIVLIVNLINTSMISLKYIRS
ncbi:MAG: hypothetical protein JRC91_13000 [Deltaproteobacteria bacterium]|nr:hypothetical protein [Deltaproteobacteria bacterium]